MKTIPAWVSLIVVFGGCISINAFAEEPPKSPLGVWEAPIGHRQPRTSEVPARENSSDAMKSNEDLKLKKALKNICRGC